MCRALRAITEEADRIPCSQQVLNDRGVLQEPRITLVVGREVVQRQQIVLESPGHQLGCSRRLYRCANDVIILATL